MKIYSQSQLKNISYINNARNTVNNNGEKSNAQLNYLIKKRQSLVENKNNLNLGALDNNQSPTAIKVELSVIDKQIEEIDEKIKKLQNANQQNNSVSSLKKSSNNSQGLNISHKKSASRFSNSDFNNQVNSIARISSSLSSAKSSYNQTRKTVTSRKVKSYTNNANRSFQYSRKQINTKID